MAAGPGWLVWSLWFWFVESASSETTMATGAVFSSSGRRARHSCCFKIGDPTHACLDFGAQTCRVYCQKLGFFCRDMGIVTRGLVKGRRTNVLSMDAASLNSSPESPEPPFFAAHHINHHRVSSDQSIASPLSPSRAAQESTTTVISSGQPAENVLQTAINSNYYAIYVGIAVALAICCLCCYFLRSFVHKCLIAMENMIGKCIYAIAIPIKGSISVFQFVFYYIKETFVYMYTTCELWFHPYRRTA